MIRPLAMLLALAACEPATQRVAGVTVDLFTPADGVDPLDGADTLMVRVRTADGELVAEGSASPGEPLPLPPITDFGPVEIIVMARSGSEVVSAARSGMIEVEAREERSIPLLFLPVNQAIPLDWRPNAQRLDHVALPLSEGEVLLVGGRDAASGLARSDSEIWSIETGFGGDGPVLPASMSEMAVGRFADGRWLLAGGRTGATASALVVEVERDGSAINSMRNLRTANADPCIGVHPAVGAFVFGPDRTAVYNPDEANGDLPGWGDFGGCAANDDAQMLIAGAETQWTLLDLSEIRGPTVDFEAVSTPFPDLPALRGMHVITLSDGTFFAGGGYGFEASRSVRIADPARREIVEAESLENARSDGQIALWRQDWVVLAGGYADASENQPVRRVDIHDPDGGPALSIETPVADPTMTVLPGGALLLTGGIDDANLPAGAYGIVPWLDDDA